MQNHEVNFPLTSYRLHYSHQIFLVRFLLHSRRSAHDLHHRFSHHFHILSELSFFLVYARHMRIVTLTFKSFFVVHRCFFVLS